MGLVMSHYAIIGVTRFFQKISGSCFFSNLVCFLQFFAVSGIPGSARFRTSGKHDIIFYKLLFLLLKNMHRTRRFCSVYDGLDNGQIFGYLQAFFGKKI